MTHHGLAVGVARVEVHGAGEEATGVHRRGVRGRAHGEGGGLLGGRGAGEGEHSEDGGAEHGLIWLVGRELRIVCV